MGLIKAGVGSLGGVLADQWKEYFYCEAIPADTMLVKGQKKVSDRSSNTKATENIITSGSTIAVADGQCMIIVDQGKVAEVCAEPGEFTYDASTEPTIFNGSLGKSIIDSFKNIGKRFTYGGEAPKDQRIYYINTKEMPGNKYGTPNPIPFRIVDKNIGFDGDIPIKCFGEYSFHICDPVLFYTNVAGNVSSEYHVSDIESQLKSELLTALQPAFAKVGELEVRYSSIPAHTKEIADALNVELTDKWKNLRGIEIVSFGMSSVTASEEDEKMLKELQKGASLGNAKIAAGNLAAAQADAMRMAAQNEGGAAIGFMGMNMAANAGGVNANNLFQMGQQEGTQAGAAGMAAGAAGWACACGTTNTGNFCTNCGQAKPAPAGWTCECGATNTGNFCTNCGKPKA